MISDSDILLVSTSLSYSLHEAVPSSPCEGSLATQSEFHLLGVVYIFITVFILFITSLLYSFYSLLSGVPSDLILPLFHTDTSESVDDELHPLNTITTVITALVFGVGGFSCVLLLATICFCVITLRKKTLKKESKVSQYMAAASQQAEQRPHYEEIPMQNYPIYHTIET